MVARGSRTAASPFPARASNAAVARYVAAQRGGALIQRAIHTWDGTRWVSEGSSSSRAVGPGRAGAAVGERYDDDTGLYAPPADAAPLEPFVFDFGGTRDAEYSPDASWTESMQSARAGTRPTTEFEDAAAVGFVHGSQRIATGFGPVTFRSGRARQPYVQSRLPDFEHQRVGLDYDEVAGILDGYAGAEREDLADDILTAMNGGAPRHHWNARTRRAAAHLIGITQLAEEHSSRTVGSAKYAQACVQAVADGTSTFVEAFNRINGLYVAAHHGGTGRMRDAAQTTASATAAATGVSAAGLELMAGLLGDADAPEPVRRGR